MIRKPQYSISKSLSILKRSGLITERRLGRFMMYRINDEDRFNKAFFESISLTDGDDSNDKAALKDFMSSDKKYGPGKCCNK